MDDTSSKDTDEAFEDMSDLLEWLEEDFICQKQKSIQAFSLNPHFSRSLETHFMVADHPQGPTLGSKR